MKIRYFAFGCFSNANIFAEYTKIDANLIYNYYNN